MIDTSNHHEHSKNPDLNELKKEYIRAFDSLPMGGVLTVPVGILTCSQKDDGRRVYSDDAIEVSLDKNSLLIVQGNHRYYTKYEISPYQEIKIKKVKAFMDLAY